MVFGARFSTIFVIALSLYVPLVAAASNESQEICELNLMSGRAVKQALARMVSARAAAQADVGLYVSKAGVYVPPATVNGVRAILKRQQALEVQNGFRGVAPATANVESYKKIGEFVVGIINHPRNIALFGEKVADVEVYGGEINGIFLQFPPQISLEARLVIFATIVARRELRVTYGSPDYLTSAEISLELVQRWTREQDELKLMLSGKFAAATVEELKILREKLLAERRAILGRDLSNAVLPEPLNRLIEIMMLNLPEDTSVHYPYNDRIAGTLAILNEGHLRSGRWALNSLRAEGKLVLNLPTSNEAIRQRLRDLVIADNTLRLLPQEAVVRVEELNSDLPQIHLVLGALGI